MPIGITAGLRWLRTTIHPVGGWLQTELYLDVDGRALSVALQRTRPILSIWVHPIRHGCRLPETSDFPGSGSAVYGQTLFVTSGGRWALKVTSHRPTLMIARPRGRPRSRLGRRDGSASVRDVRRRDGRRWWRGCEAAGGIPADPAPGESGPPGGGPIWARTRAYLPPSRFSTPNKLTLLTPVT